MAIVITIILIVSYLSVIFILGLFILEDIFNLISRKSAQRRLSVMVRGLFAKLKGLGGKIFKVIAFIFLIFLFVFMKKSDLD